MSVGGPVEVIPVSGLPEVRPGDDLATLIAAHADLADGDVVVVAQKVVSKAEGALVPVPAGSDVDSARRALARTLARRVVADASWALVVETTHGLVCANAGVDASNVPGNVLVRLPDDPDASAARLRSNLRAVAGVDVAVVISDTFGRPWRLGQTDVAIGSAGLAVLRDEPVDREGRVMRVTAPAIVDELAGAADLVRGKADGVPVVVVRGFAFEQDERARAADLVRPSDLDLFPRGRGMLAAALATEPVDPVGPPPAADLAAALAAGDRAGAGRVELRLLDQAPSEPARVAVIPLGDASLMETGAAAATLVAAALDLGLAATTRYEAAGPVVALGRPPEPAATGAS